MSNLDDKLREIARDYGVNPDHNDIVARVKQVFADDPDWVEYGVMPLAPQIKKQAAQYGLMLGQEWYDRFLISLPPTKGVVDTGIVIEAAQKASGIDNEN